MNYVEPIRDNNKLEDIIKYLKNTNTRNYILFILGLFTGLRISDILKIQVKHVRNKKEIRIKEKKTGKFKVIKMNKFLKKELEIYIQDKDDYEYLIANSKTGHAPITRQHAYRIVKEVCKKFGIENVGTHSLRKTFGYNYYKKTKNIAVLQNIFNHSEPSITLRYIGINQDTISDAYESMSYF
ncbi:site-specific integrase [Peptostreptococcus canis]|uniref:Site-specific integrase n=1 Tax=Peptostreptococcus canis TaxID=1159213 RepID=A0ABR6TML8_9FIRM|nr:site-specific integrase [Peptostreptococcus canis]MBC2576565.1 site-specific integrase [Peptostreptococcus canis]MBP1998752.1 integrase [Peptostreptococcus canis]